MSLIQWTDEEIDRARMLVTAVREQRFGSLIQNLAARFQLDREEAVSLYHAIFTASTRSREAKSDE